MSLPKLAVNTPTVTAFTTVLVVIAGLYFYTTLGQLEDPESTIKTAVVATPYPGAAAQEVELEVTDRLEIAIQEMPQIKNLESLSRPGLSLITVNILPSYPSSELPQIWDELRKKVGDAAGDLPPGTGQPEVRDDFGDIYGFFLALSGDGFSYFELEDLADGLKKELSLIDGVARVELWGVQQRCVYVDVSQAQLSQLGLTMEDIGRTFTEQNLVVDSGSVDLPDERLRIEQTGAFTSPEDIENLTVRGRTYPQPAANDELLRIRDIASVRLGYAEPPAAVMRYNGRPALGLAISNVSGANIVDLGERIDRRLAELTADLPVGVEIDRISWQSDLVAESIRAFVVSLMEAVAIVLIVLWIATGFRMAMIVGLCGLVFTILATFLAMSLWGIDLQRMSLGALVIAMGMMVDNAIVVADGIAVRLRQGVNRITAAVEAANQPAWPLLGATVIGVMAFYPIYASEESAGEYCQSLFQVVGVSLLLSWVLSVTITPLMCAWLLPGPSGDASDEALYSGRLYGVFQSLLERALRYRLVVIGTLCVLLALALVGFTRIDRTFFPDSARLQIMVDFWAPEGTRIQATSADLRRIEDHLADDPRVTSVSTFVGQGPARFYLPVEPEKPYSSYGQLIVNVTDLRALNGLIPALDSWLEQNVPQAVTVVRRYGLGPSETWKVQTRISGPAVADENQLRSLAGEAVEILQADPNTKVVRTNWRRRVRRWLPTTTSSERVGPVCLVPTLPPPRVGPMTVLPSVDTARRIRCIPSSCGTSTGNATSSPARWTPCKYTLRCRVIPCRWPK